MACYLAVFLAHSLAKQSLFQHEITGMSSLLVSRTHRWPFSSTFLGSLFALPDPRCYRM